MDKMGFVFSTKANNLFQLKSQLKSGFICDMFAFTLEDWQKEKQIVIAQIQQRFAKQAIIVRSSGLLEDTKESSMAGAFCSVLNVSLDEEQIENAINTVIQSYYKAGVEDITEYQILIQSMMQDVALSGVIFTRELEKFSPYYLINYDDQTRKTDSITNGHGREIKALKIYKCIDSSLLEPRIRKIIQVVREIEELTGTDKLDIEFALDSKENVYIFQVRPIIITGVFSCSRMDHQIEQELSFMEQFLESNFSKKYNLYGDTTVFGEMPDWNPAEIIGSHPKPLASSLYQYLIIKSAWRESRNLMGYYHPFPCNLMVMLAGRPYVDVRKSFNSFLPKQLPSQLSTKLINYYINRLKTHPEYHDKVEFEIVISCLDFNFPKHENSLRENGFSPDEISVIKDSLLFLTNSIILDQNHILQEMDSRIEELGVRREAILERKERAENIPMIVQQLLDDCIFYGAIPFSVFARCAFIGSSFLKSLLNKGIISDDDYHSFLNSIETVATEMVEELELYRAGNIPLDRFLQKYGHLRPGTYDIATYRYDEKPHMYLSAEKKTTSERKKEISKFVFTNEQYENIDQLLKKYQFDFTAEQLIDFIRVYLQKREYAKFEFTKNLSDALELITQYGAYHGLTKEELAFLKIDDILSFAHSNYSLGIGESIKSIIERNEKYYEFTSFIQLPDLILSKQDLKVISLQCRKPNFISQRKVIARSVIMDNLKDQIQCLSLSGKIILIENADPGYDWLFTKNIAGLVTKCGGAASHMAIRAAEFGLPAAIGCGEQIYNSLLKAEVILLDCKEKRVARHGIS